MHLDVNRDEVPGGEAELFDDFEADQAALARNSDQLLGKRSLPGK